MKKERMNKNDKDYLKKRIEELVSSNPSDHLDMSLFYYKKNKGTKKVFNKTTWLFLSLIIFHFVAYLVFVSNSTEISDDDKMLFFASYVIFITIMMPFIQNMITPREKDNTEKIEFLLLYLATILTEQANISAKEIEKFKEVLEKIEHLDTIEIFQDEDFEFVKRNQKWENLSKENNI